MVDPGCQGEAAGAEDCRLLESSVGRGCGRAMPGSGWAALTHGGAELGGFTKSLSVSSGLNRSWEGQR